MAIQKELLPLLYGGWNNYREWADHDFRLKGHVSVPEEAVPPEPPAPRFSPAAPRPHLTPRPARAPLPPPAPRPVPAPGPPAEPTGEAVRPRPYVLTDGRTRPRTELELHALVSTTPRGLAEMRELFPEHRTLCLMCREPHSVAEVSALLHLPLGVTRVLIDDLAQRGLIEVGAPAEQPGPRTLLRLIEGLRAL